MGEEGEIVKPYLPKHSLIYWMFNHGPINNEFMVKGASLTLSPVQMDHSGTYTCYYTESNPYDGYDTHYLAFVEVNIYGKICSTKTIAFNIMLYKCNCQSNVLHI